MAVWALLVLLCSLMLVPGTRAGAQDPAPVQDVESVPSGPHLRADGHVSLAWFFGGTSADYRAQIEQMPGLTTISPTWWYLDETQPGALELDTDDELVAWSQARGLAVWPLFGNHINPDLTDQVLRDPALRQQVVAGIAAEVHRSGVDGVNVDFENLHDDTRFLLTDLVAELKAALPDKVISVDVTSMTDTWVLDNWSTAFDREGLGRVADYVMLMAYDQHNSLRRDGPVAGLQWVRESTEFLLRTVPAHKVVLGLPLYSRDWATDPDARDGVDLDATLGMAAMARRVAQRAASATFDPVAGQDLYTYTDEAGRPHRIWLEDVASLQRKTDLVAEFGLAGIAAWRAGFEQPEVWTALDAQLTAMARPAPPVAAPAPTPAPSVTAGPLPLQPAVPSPPDVSTLGEAQAVQPPGEVSDSPEAPAPTTQPLARSRTTAADADRATVVAGALLALVGLGHVGRWRFSRRRRGW